MTTSPKTVGEVLRAAAELLTPEGAWTQGSFARNREGGALLTGSSRGAVCWCALGAIDRCVGDADLWDAAAGALAKAISGTADTINATVAAFNDNPLRTQAEVIAALTRAAELADQAQ